ncbi:MAG: hypothetical protein JO215_17065 [Ktedonobacteraceae bacterium]|nr:hypothetical protein [Ktedonobacteraceae bacterium]
MYRRKERAWYLWPRRRKRHSESEEAIFTDLRLHLILWYSCILGGTLLAISLFLYFGVIQITGSRLRSDLSFQAEQIRLRWQAAPTHKCPLPIASSIYNMACFTPHGTLISMIGPGNNEFLNNSLVTATLRESPQDDTIAGLTRYAQTVPAPGHHGILGIVEVGEPNTIRSMIFSWFPIEGLLLLITVPLGGIWLSNRALAPARQAFKQQKEFIANASHELRTPLTLLRANAEVLLRGRERMDEEDIELLEDIVADANHMGTLANNMLLLARIDTGRLHLEQEVLDLGNLATGVLHRARSLANQMHIALEAKNIQPALVLGDRVMLEQVILILLDNAIKYNQPDGSIIVNTYTDKEQAHLEISDTGIGIAPEHLPHLGKRFYRVDKARSRETGGSGLGLSIARSIATTHHGTLTISSRAGQGTTVLLSLPALRSSS